MYRVITFNRIDRSIKNSVNSMQLLAVLKWIELFEYTFKSKEDANFLRKLAVARLNKFGNLYK